MTTLNLSDIFFMRAVLPLSEVHRQLLGKLMSKNKRSIPDEISHELTNLCRNQLATNSRFNGYNSLTVEGRKLEEILDKLYVG
jgi:hypothetical protein